MSIEKVLYRAGATASGGGRDGRSVSTDGQFDFNLTIPKELGGPGGAGANPEQLFALGYAACFLGAMRFVGMRDKLPVPKDATVSSSVGIGALPTGFGIEVQLTITMPGVERDVAQTVVDRAHIVCPYSNATRGNIDVTLTLA